LLELDQCLLAVELRVQEVGASGPKHALGIEYF
jgi:hypothetical protein